MPLFDKDCSSKNHACTKPNRLFADLQIASSSKGASTDRAIYEKVVGCLFTERVATCDCFVFNDRSAELLSLSSLLTLGTVQFMNAVSIGL
jgi:hypothetical protein